MRLWRRLMMKFLRLGVMMRLWLVMIFLGLMIRFMMNRLILNRFRLRSMMIRLWFFMVVVHWLFMVVVLWLFMMVVHWLFMVMVHWLLMMTMVIVISMIMAMICIRSGRILFLIVLCWFLPNKVMSLQCSRNGVQHHSSTVQVVSSECSLN